MKKMVGFISLICLVLFLFLKLKTSPTISYFPIDKHAFFTTAITELYQSQESKNYIIWKSNSISNQPMYLRQDVSILYENGQFKGIQSKWEENEKEIELKKDVKYGNSHFFQALSYHHGEIHHANNEITSIQKMSYDYLYVIHEMQSSFKQPIMSEYINWQTNIDQKINQQLTNHWNQLINHFSIPKNKYILVPLTNLMTYQTKPLPGLTIESSEEVIGQLWEGLYKNYIIPIVSEKNNQVHHFIPLIMFARDGTHLLVLFELNGKKQKLLQMYPQETLSPAVP